MRILAAIIVGVANALAPRYSERLTSLGANNSSPKSRSRNVQFENSLAKGSESMQLVISALRDFKLHQKLNPMSPPDEGENVVRS